MPKPFLPRIKKLQTAINEHTSQKILINKTQFYSESTDRVLEIIVIKQAQWNSEKQKFQNVELFSSASDVQILLWLRDYWYTLNGWEVPTDNPKWEEAKKKYNEKHEPNDITPKKRKKKGEHTAEELDNKYSFGATRRRSSNGKG